MTGTRHNRRLDRPREQVLTAALDMVAESGLEKLTMAALAARLGTSGGHLLYYFKTRDGLLRAAMPGPIGTCHFVNDLTIEDLVEGLHAHKALCASYPRHGEGVDAFTAPEDADLLAVVPERTVA